MCVSCVQIAKELLTPVEFWNNYRESNAEHGNQMVNELKKTSEEYQTQVALEALRSS